MLRGPSGQSTTRTIRRAYWSLHSRLEPRASVSEHVNDITRSSERGGTTILAAACGNFRNATVHHHPIRRPATIVSRQSVAAGPWRDQGRFGDRHHQCGWAGRTRRPMTVPPPAVRVFNGDGGRFPGGVFSTRALAEAWIAKHRLTGTLPKYVVETDVYEWAIEQGHFKPKRAFTPREIGASVQRRKSISTTTSIDTGCPLRIDGALRRYGDGRC
jgi:hypothetical protein